MKRTHSKGAPFGGRAGEWAGDLAAWTRQNAADNSQQLERLRRGLRRAGGRGAHPPAAAAAVAVL